MGHRIEWGGRLSLGQRKWLEQLLWFGRVQIPRWRFGLVNQSSRLPGRWMGLEIRSKDGGVFFDNVNGLPNWDGTAECKSLACASGW